MATKWVTRESVRVDRVSSSWLILSFVDPDATLLYVPTDQVLAVAEQENAIPFDIPGVEMGHHGDECAFDALLQGTRHALFHARVGMNDIPALAHLLLPAQDEVVKNPFERFVDQPQKQGHGEHEGENDQGDLGCFFALGPDHTASFRP